MADKGPFLTSCIIFYLSIGAAIFQILEEPNWEAARDKYIHQKENILQKYPCLTKDDLDYILEAVSEAAGQGVTITGDKHRNTWDWANSVVFAATIVTTIGYGNVAPKTQGGRLFCIFYGLCGIPLCLVWISELGSFFGDRAKRLSQVLIRKGISVKKVQLTCTALFLLWGLLVHLVIPPFVFMSVERWSYLEGLYFSCITLTTVGFGDYVAGVNPNIEYPRLYRVFAEIWIYMGLAWLSLFFSWNVHMVVEAHKVFKKRIHKNRPYYDEDLESVEDKPKSDKKPTAVDIFNFLEEEEEDYSTVIKNIGTNTKGVVAPADINRSKSCSDILANNIRTLDHSPRSKRKSISELFVNTMVKSKSGRQGKELILEESGKHGTAEDERGTDNAEEVEDNVFYPDTGGIEFTAPIAETTKEEGADAGKGGGNRFTVSKVAEDLINTDEKG